MNTKTMKVLGIVFLVLGIGGIAGGIFFWFFHYSAMQNGLYHYGDSLMIACTISLLMGLLLYAAIPLLIVSKVRRNREVKNATIQMVSAQNNVVSTAEYCIYCGAKLNVGENFCIKCGRKLH